MTRADAVSVYSALLEAWNRRDADAFAAVFTADGTSVGFDGSQMNGREQIASTLRAIFADHLTAIYVAKIREVRYLDASGTTLVRAVVGMIPRGGSELNPALNAVQGVVLVKESEQLRIALLQNTPAAFHGRPQLVEALTKELSEVATSRLIVEDEPGH